MNPFQKKLKELSDNSLKAKKANRKEVAKEIAKLEKATKVKLPGLKKQLGL